MENYIRNKQQEQEVIDDVMDSIDFESLVRAKEYLYSLNNEDYEYCGYEDNMTFRDKVVEERTGLRNQLKNAFDSLHQSSISGTFKTKDGKTQMFYQTNILGTWDISLEYWPDVEDGTNPYIINCSYDLFSYFNF